MLPILIQRFSKYVLTFFLIVRSLVGSKKVSRNSFIFFYGAGMTPERFSKWRLNYEIVGPARILDSKLVFEVACEYKGKGFASVKYSPGQEVWGLLYKMDYLSLVSVDIMEWVLFQFYKREIRTVYTENNEQKNAWVYLAVHPRTGLVPSKSYVDMLERNCERLGFPKAYLSKVRENEHKIEFEYDHNFSLWNPKNERFLSEKLNPVYRSIDRLSSKIAELLP